VYVIPFETIATVAAYVLGAALPATVGLCVMVDPVAANPPAVVVGGGGLDTVDTVLANPPGFVADVPPPATDEVDVEAVSANPIVVPVGGGGELVVVIVDSTSCRFDRTEAMLWMAEEAKTLGSCPPCLDVPDVGSFLVAYSVRPIKATVKAKTNSRLGILRTAGT
jgi:hypothetical protein